MSYRVDNTVKDVSRAIARLDAFADQDPYGSDPFEIDGQNWTGLDLKSSVVFTLGSQVNNVFNTLKITKNSVAAMLAAHGASTFTIERWAGPIAREMRADFGIHTWTGTRK